MKIEIKNRFTGSVIFSHEAVENTIAITLIAAIAARANLYGANLKEIKNGTLVLARTQITPQEGAFVGWKKLRIGVIARLVIVHDAKRLNSYGSRKCRASAVIVHEMFNSDGTQFTGVAFDKHTGKTKYETGCTILPDSFDEDRQVECSHGIHFFMTREEAEAY